MSLDPNLALARLRKDAGANCPFVSVEREALAHLLKMFDHQEAQLVALRALKTKSVAAAPATETVCQEADRVVSFDRQDEYGHPRDNMQRTAAMWEAILGLPPGGIDPEQVAMCMIAVKLSRLCNRYKRDSIVDIAGYAKVLDYVVRARPVDAAGKA